MTHALLEPTEDERAATTQLRVQCQRLLREDPDRRSSVVRELELRASDVDRLLRRDDWTLSAALRIARALGIGATLQVHVP